MRAPRELTLAPGVESGTQVDMTDSVVSRARARLVELKREASRLEAFLETYDQLSKDLSRAETPLLAAMPTKALVTPPMAFFGGEVPEAALVAQERAARRMRLPRHRQQTSQVYVAAREVLDEAGRPVALKDLLSAIQAKGVHIGGSEPRSNLSARLGQSPYFVSIPNVGWWFKDRPVPKEEAASPEPGEAV